MKVVLNKKYGGFSLSENALNDLGIEEEDRIDYCYDNNTRFDEHLIQLIEEKGSEYCSGFCAELEIVEISDFITDYKIMDYDGMETIIYVEDGKIRQA